MPLPFRPRRGVAFSDKIGDTLADVPAPASPDRYDRTPETTLALNAAFVNALYNGLTEAILAVQFGTRRIVHWNKGAEAMFGYSAQEVLGKKTEILYPDQHSFERISEFATPEIREHGAWRTEWRYRRRDGSTFPADVVATMIEGSEGSQFYVIVVRDIAARKRSEAEFLDQGRLLLRIRQRLQAVLDNTTMLIYVAGSDGKLGLINKRFETLFKLNEADSVGTSLYAVFDKETADVLVANNAKVLETKTTMEFEEVIPLSDGPHTYISAKIPLHDERGFLYAVCTVSTDITERKRDQQTIEKMNQELEGRVTARTSELQTANEQLRLEISNRRQTEEKLLQSERMAAIGVTTAKLVHEIANPLQTMITAVEILDRHLSGDPLMSPEKITSIVNDLKAEINLLLNFLDEFKEIARPRKLEVRPLDLVGLARELLSLEAPHYAKLGIRIEEDFAAEVPLIEGDSTKLRQVLLNLCKNAVEAMPSGGTLKLRAHSEAGQLVFEVADTGEGIPDELNVFELFTTSKPLGTGLGLAIVQEIVSAHRGVISYTSELNKGTSFQFRIPLLGDFGTDSADAVSEKR